MTESNFDKSMGLKAKYSLYSALLFFLIANPETYKLTNSLFGKFFKTANNGCATAAGLFLHASVFFLLIWGLMMLPKDN